jgi:hypothetical protein
MGESGNVYFGPGQLRPVVAVHGKHDGRHPPSPGILLRAEGSHRKLQELREGEQEGTIATDVADGRTTGLINRLRPEPAPYDDLPRMPLGRGVSVRGIGKRRFCAMYI